MRIIAVTGGIGAGKSVVCRILDILGYPVYDCDSRAKYLMDNSQIIKKRIAEEICGEALSDNGTIDRKRLAKEVFSNRKALLALNSITHSAVREDLLEWARGRDIAFVETAIFNESGLRDIVDEVWTVVAPEEVRINRVMHRNGLSREEIKARIDNQSQTDPDQLPMKIIVNDGNKSLILRITSLLTHLPDS